MKASISKKLKLSPTEKSMTRNALISMDDKEQRHRYSVANARDELSQGARSRLIHPAVFNATADELIAAGWEAYERHLIPPEWRTRKPASFVGGVGSVH